MCTYSIVIIINRNTLQASAWNHFRQFGLDTLWNFRGSRALDKRPTSFSSPFPLLKWVLDPIYSFFRSWEALRPWIPSILQTRSQTSHLETTETHRLDHVDTVKSVLNIIFWEDDTDVQSLWGFGSTSRCIGILFPIHGRHSMAQLAQTHHHHPNPHQVTQLTKTSSSTSVPPDRVFTVMPQKYQISSNICQTRHISRQKYDYLEHRKSTRGSFKQYCCGFLDSRKARLAQ